MGTFWASAPTDPDGTAILLEYLKRSPPSDAPSPGPALSPLSPSNMSVATATYMRRHSLLAGPLELLPPPGPETAPLADKMADGGGGEEEEEKPQAGRMPTLARAPVDASVGNILDLSRLRQLPKLF